MNKRKYFNPVMEVIEFHYDQILAASITEFTGANEGTQSNSSGGAHNWVEEPNGTGFASIENGEFSW